MLTTNTPIPIPMPAVDAGAAVDRLAPGPDAPKPAGSAERIDWIFRDALRNQQVHPLMDLVRRYRARDVP